MRASGSLNNLWFIGIAMLVLLVAPARTVDVSRSPEAVSDGAVPVLTTAYMHPWWPAFWPDSNVAVVNQVLRDRGLEGPSIGPAPRQTSDDESRKSSDATWQMNRDVALVGGRLDVDQFAPRRADWVRPPDRHGGLNRLVRPRCSAPAQVWLRQARR
jgi:hypothetical protein